jgi:uncharacterized protein YndB with AHSA1/START domain
VNLTVIASYGWCVDEVSVTRVIPAPLAEVWRVFADPAARSRFCDVCDVEALTDFTPGDLSPGTRWRETRTTATGDTITEELVILAVEPERSCTVALAGAIASGQLTYRFQPARDGAATVVTINTQKHRYGFANRLLGFIVGGFAARTAEGALRAQLDVLAEGCRAGAWA